MYMWNRNRIFRGKYGENFYDFGLDWGFFRYEIKGIIYKIKKSVNWIFIIF